MKRFLMAGAVVTLALVGMAAQASAADLGRRVQMPVKAPVAPVPYYNWTGFYVGVNGGGGWGQSNWDAPGVATGDFNLSGGLVGGTLGYNYQVGQAVFGIEGDIDWSSIKGSSTTNCPLGCETRNSWLGTVRGRLGYAFDRFMPYVTGGVAFGDIKATANGLGSQTSTNAGWTVGAGVEAALVGNWTAKVEYLYVDLGSFNCSLGACSTTVTPDVDFRSHLVRAGINYRF
jgi:outer membrane immunogenic protein